MCYIFLKVIAANFMLTVAIFENIKIAFVYYYYYYYITLHKRWLLKGAMRAREMEGILN